MLWTRKRSSPKCNADINHTMLACSILEAISDSQTIFKYDDLLIQLGYIVRLEKIKNIVNSRRFIFETK